LELFRPNTTATAHNGLVAGSSPAGPTTHSIRCAFTVDFDRKEMGYSPDRVDALVWALTELMIEGGARRRLLFV